MEERKQTWKKVSQGANNCVEVAYVKRDGEPAAEVRDSKAPDRGSLRFDLGRLLDAAKADRFTR